ncbi:hypothetical protein NE237_012711 [Protea cynaroides]|uniref:Uncharacterized protein n=1 Tax=Protea cynaroides TaxID=273540 RepID=A0A9Q0H0B0_9MAGN|nr:hypothetical protein NE237_012711 [Protea cynaroides]
MEYSDESLVYLEECIIMHCPVNGLIEGANRPQSDILFLDYNLQQLDLFSEVPAETTNLFLDCNLQQLDLFSEVLAETTNLFLRLQPTTTGFIVRGAWRDLKLLPQTTTYNNCI